MLLEREYRYLIMNEDIRKHVLIALDATGYRYIVRDKAGDLYAFEDEPFKSGNEWNAYDYEVADINKLEHLFKDVTWESGEYLDVEKELKTIDWTKVPKDTKVYVRNDENEEWEKAYFECYKPKESPQEPFITFGCGATSWSAQECESWRYCKLAEH